MSQTTVNLFTAYSAVENLPIAASIVYGRPVEGWPFNLPIGSVGTQAVFWIRAHEQKPMAPPSDIFKFSKPTYKRA